MVTFEITATARLDLTGAFETFMREGHIPDVVATRCFTSAVFAQSTHGRYRIWYEATDQAALDRYVSDHAPRLRADLMRHFPDGVELSREVWTVVQNWS